MKWKINCINRENEFLFLLYRIIHKLTKIENNDLPIKLPGYFSLLGNIYTLSSNFFIIMLKCIMFIFYFK